MNKGLTGLTRDYASKSMSKCSNDGGEKNNQLARQHIIKYPRNYRQWHSHAC